MFFSGRKVPSGFKGMRIAVPAANYSQPRSQGNSTHTSHRETDASSDHLNMAWISTCRNLSNSCGVSIRTYPVYPDLSFDTRNRPASIIYLVRDIEDIGVLGMPSDPRSSGNIQILHAL